ncbi:hypothetical protein Taro_039399 [Colocasia esculenta]|uniref:Uncharacterized protein n=1 Tax=Colocasia esculenta TaxID=4460 RepID=A0A843W989_COLES|nr:hypothetical protein [Colocasia esculenta]
MGKLYNNKSCKKVGFYAKKLRSRRTLVSVVTGSGRQIATESYEDRDGSFDQATRTRQGSLSRSNRDRYMCRDGPENAAYRVVTFSGTSPEFEREKGLAWDCMPT